MTTILIKNNYCFNCNENRNDQLKHVFGYTICEHCFTKLRLLSQKTIKSHNDSKENYSQEVNDRLIEMERDYIKTRIKLLAIQESLKKI